MDHLAAVSLVAKAIAEQQNTAINDNGTASGNSSGLNFQLCQSQVVVNVSSSQCVTIKNYTLGLKLFSFLFSLIVMIGFQFIQKRIKQCPTCCFGRPGLLIPVDLIRHSKYRLIYVAIFGSLSFLFYNILTGDVISQLGHLSSNPYSDKILSIFATLILVSVICIWYYPLFVCVDTPVPIIGHVVGLIFSILTLTIVLLDKDRMYTGCADGCRREKVQFAIEILSGAPRILLLVFLVFWFFGSIVYDIYTMIMRRNRLPPSEYSYLQDHIQRVKHRLAKNKADESSTVKTRFAKILHTIYPYDHAFKFPLRFLAGMTVAICVVYQLALTTTYESIALTIALADIRKQFLLFVEELLFQFAKSGSNDSVIEMIIEVVKVIVNTAVILGVCLIIAVVLATIFCFIQLFLTFRNVSIHLHLSTKGDKSFLPNQFPTLQKGLIASFKYPGYLIAYSVWAWIVYTTVLMLIAIILVIGGRIVQYIHLIVSYLGPKILVAIIGIIWTQLFYWSQFFFTKYVFLKKAYPDSKHSVFNNRRLIHWFTYFVLFQNAFVGLFSTFIRIIMSLGFGLLTFSRLDKVLLIRGWESFDAAYKTYVGMLYLDHIQNNSVMNVFCHVMLKQVRLKRRIAGEEIESEGNSCNCYDVGRNTQLRDEAVTINNVADSENMKYHRLDEVIEDQPPSRPRMSQRAYNRWMVAYTLIRNKSLIELTASSINQKKTNLNQRLNGSNDSELLNYSVV